MRRILLVVIMICAVVGSEGIAFATDSTFTLRQNHALKSLVTDHRVAGRYTVAVRSSEPYQIGVTLRLRCGRTVFLANGFARTYPAGLRRHVIRLSVRRRSAVLCARRGRARLTGSYRGHTLTTPQTPFRDTLSFRL